MKLQHLQTRVYEAVQYRLQGLALTTGRNLSKPTFVCIKLTMRCNSRCRHCDIYKPEHTTAELSTAEWLEVLRGLRRWLGRGAPLTFTGGEMLLRRDVFDILEAARDHGFALHLLSNGWLLDEKRADRLMALDPRTFQVSLDAIADDVHDYLRGLEGFGDRAQRALRALADARQRHRATTEILVGCVIFNRNIDELERVVRWTAEHDIGVVKFQPVEQTYMEAHDPTWFKRSPLWIDEPARVVPVIDRLVRMKQEGYPIHNTIESLEFIKQYFADPLGLGQKVVSHDQHFQSKNCRSAVGDFDITSNGDVRLCYRMEPIGNVARQDPRTIWNQRRRCWTAYCPYLDQDAVTRAAETDEPSADGRAATG